MSRVIVLDTETTGMPHANGHRIIEIGCLELVDFRKGEKRQWYLNPERKIDPGATKVHGITDEQVADAPRFADIVADFLAFIGEDPLVIHNASFDMGFLNMELERCRCPKLADQRAIDTLSMARRKFPGSPASLDALCRRFKVDNTNRTFHGALLDSELLAEVYIELMGGNQYHLSLDFPSPTTSPQGTSASPRDAEGEDGESTEWPPVPRRSWPIRPDEESRHDAFVQRLVKESGVSFWPSPD